VVVVYHGFSIFEYTIRRTEVGLVQAYYGLAKGRALFSQRINLVRRLVNTPLARLNTLALIANGYFSEVFQQNRPEAVSQLFSKQTLTLELTGV
jgi:hypothetical protein